MNAESPTRRWGWYAVILFGALLLIEVAMGFLPQSQLGRAWFHDAQTYTDAAQRWLATGDFYSPYQLAGPYEIVEREVLYPPVSLLLFVPLSFVPVLWLAPALIVGWIVWTQRPGPWRLAAMLACLTLPIHFSTSVALEAIANGTPVVWTWALIALATRFPVFGPWVLFRPAPVVIPFALIGIRSRQWWVGLGLFALASLVFLPMWFDYLRVMLNARGGDVLYGLTYVPMLCIPLIGGLDVEARAVRSRLRRSRRGPDRPVVSAPPARADLGNGAGR